MESGIVLNLQKHEHHYKIRYNNSFYYRKTFVQPPRKTQQRLIRLTPSIRKAMIDFNGSPSNTSISEKLFYNTISITSLVRGEVHNILQDLSISDKFIRKEEIDDLIEKCLREKVTIIEENYAKLNISEQSDFELQQEIEATVEKDTNKLILENFQILELRINNLEGRLNALVQTIPKLRYIKSKQLKINTNAIKKEMRSVIEKLEKEINNGEQKTATVTTELEKVKRVTKEKPLNIYDDMYYRRREYAINLLNYKKSLETIELNEKSVLNPYVKPCHEELPQLPKKLKRRPIFLTANEL